MPDSEPSSSTGQDDALALADAVREAEEVRRLRAARDRALSPTERLERVEALCRALASIRIVD
jgi:hypothetical protein